MQRSLSGEYSTSKEDFQHDSRGYLLASGVRPANLKSHWSLLPIAIVANMDVVFI